MLAVGCSALAKGVRGEYYRRSGDRGAFPLSVGSAVRSGHFLRQLRELRQLIGNVKPRCFVGDEYMKLGFDAGIIIERSKGKAVRGRIVVKPTEKRSPTDAAEAPVVARRGLEIGNEFFALNPSEIAGTDAGATAKSRAMRFSARRAVAVERTGQPTSDLVPDTTAQATTAQH